MVLRLYNRIFGRCQLEVAAKTHPLPTASEKVGIDGPTSTGSITEEGKQHSRCNAVRHGLTAETAIGALEDTEDYKAFEAAIIADYDAQSAVERELVSRLASLRLRRATTMETDLFEISSRLSA